MVKCIYCGAEIEGSIRDHLIEKHKLGTPQAAPAPAIIPENTTKNTLSKKMKIKIKAESRLIFTDDNKDTPMKGYLFKVDDSESSSASQK